MEPLCIECSKLAHALRALQLAENPTEDEQLRQPVEHHHMHLADHNYEVETKTVDARSDCDSVENIRKSTDWSTETQQPNASQRSDQISALKSISWITASSRTTFSLTVEEQLPEVDYEPIYHMPEEMHRKLIRDPQLQIKEFFERVKQHHRTNPPKLVKHKQGQSDSTQSHSKKQLDRRKGQKPE